MYLILNFVIQNTNSILYTIVLSFCLIPKYSRIKSIALHAFICLLIFSYKFLFFNNPNTLLISSLISQTLLFLFVLIAFKDSIFVKILLTMLLLSLNLISEYISLGFLHIIGSPANALQPDSLEFLLAGIAGVTFQIILYPFFIFLYKYCTKKQHTQHLLVFSLIPSMQLLPTLILAPIVIGINNINKGFVLTATVMSLAADIVLLYYILKKQEKRTIEDAYCELQRLYAIETEQYKALEMRHEELSKLRHDYNNHLIALHILISSGEIDSAKKLANSLKRKM